MRKPINHKLALYVAVLLMLSLFTQVLPRQAIAIANTAPKTESGTPATAPMNEVGLPKPEPAPTVAPDAAVIVATLTDNVTAATKVAPGGTINYTATITNNGAASPADDATNLNFSAPLDANTTLVAGSVHASPIAFNDTYNWVGNTFLDTATRGLPAVIANDVAVNAPAGTDTFTATAINGGATALGGVVNLASPAGSFTYTPPLGRPNAVDGATVQDSFTYTITSSADPTLTSTGTVKINLTGRVWYLQAGGVGDGRSQTPSGSPSAMSTAADKSTDIFYILATNSNLNGPFSLDSGQQLLGQGVNLVVNAITLFTGGANPPVTNTAGNCVTLAGAPGNNTLSGFDIGVCTGGTAIAGSNVGTLTVSTLSINTNGGGLDLTGVGTPTVNIVLGALTATGGTFGANLVGMNGTINLAGGALSGASGTEFRQSGGNATTSYSGSISKTSAGLIADVQSRTGNTLTLSGSLTCNTSCTGVNVSSNSGGTIAFSGTPKTINTSAGASAGVTLSSNGGATVNFSGGGLDIDSSSGIGFTATGGGTFSVTGSSNAINSTSATALNVVSTTIGAGLNFHDISSGNNTAAADPANGIVLNNTGSVGLTVTGNGANDASGGTIQNNTNDGILLTTTQNVSLTSMSIQSSAHYGVSGTGVINFSFINGTINNSGTGLTAQDSNIGFNLPTTGSSNISGTLSVTGSTLTNSFYHGVTVRQDTGTISNANISNNTFTSSTVAANSNGSAIDLDPGGSAGGAANIIQGTIDANTITNFPSGAGIQVLGGNTNSASAPFAVMGCNPASTLAQCLPLNAANKITISNNNIAGDSGTKLGTNGIACQSNGRGETNIEILNNGTAGNRMKFFLGNGILYGCTGRSVCVGKINNNFIDGSSNIVASPAISIGVDATFANTDTANFTLQVSGNDVNPGSDGNGILATVRASSGTGIYTIKSNNIGAPRSGVRQGIRVDAGNASSLDDAVCLDIASNTSNFSVGQPGAMGIGLRKQGTTTTTNDFGVENLAVFSSPGPENLVNSQNPAGNGTLLISATSGFSACTAPNRPETDSTEPTLKGFDSLAEFFEAVKQRRTSAPDGEETTGGPLVNGGMIEKNWGVIPPAGNDNARNRMDGRSDRYSPTYAIAGASAELAKHPATLTPAAPVVTDVAGPGYRSSLGNVLHHALNALSSAVHKVDSAITPTAYAQKGGQSPDSGENVTLNTIATFPAGGKSITIKYSATVNSPPLVRQVSTQGTVTANGGAISVQTDDPDVAGTQATSTLVDTLMTWNGGTSIDWNTATNWTPPAGGTQYAPGVSNPAVNDVVIPNVGAQPNISATDITIFSLNISNGRTLTITNPRVLTIGGSPGGDLTLDGIISGGFLNLGTGTHLITNAGGTGSLSSTNVATVLSGGTVTLNNNLQAGALAVNAGGSMNITSRTLSLNGSGAALTVPAGATFTTTSSTVVFNGTAAQQAGGIAYNNLTINNTLGLNVTGVTLTGNATVNGVLTLTSSDLDTGAFTLTMPAAATSGPATNATDVVGNVKRTGFIAGTNTLSFGNPFNTIKINSGAVPTDINVNLAKSAPVGFSGAVQRTYTITPNGANGPATLRLHYLDTELNGNTPEANLNLRRFNGTVWQPVLATTSNTGDATNNWLENNNVATFSPWTFSTFSPSASNSSISGHITDANGDPLGGVVVGLSNGRRTITRADGNYLFSEVPTGDFYTLTPMLANHSFTPHTRSFSLLGNMTDAAFAGAADGSQTANPLDTDMYFVRQQYLDFLGREPDEPGLQFWTNQISGCLDDQVCIHNRRIDVSAQFFIAQEFQLSGSFIYDLYQGSLGRRPMFTEYASDRPQVIGGSDLDTQKATFAGLFVQRPEFVKKYQSQTTAETFVDALLQTVQQSGVDLSSQRDSLIATYNGGTDMTNSRALVVRAIADDGVFRQSQYNQAFVLMEYFDYLQRDIDQSGYNFWLDVLNQGAANNYRGMVCSFLTSAEYQRRFATVVTRSNGQCSGQ